MTDNQDRDATLDGIVGELEEAGLVEQYVNAAGEPVVRLTKQGQQVANQLAMTPGDDATKRIAGLLGDELEGDDDGAA